MHIAVNYKTDSCYKQMNNRYSGDDRRKIQLWIIALISHARKQLFKISFIFTRYKRTWALQEHSLFIFLLNTLKENHKSETPEIDVNNIK